VKIVAVRDAEQQYAAISSHQSILQQNFINNIDQAWRSQ
jgi:hypothetical protein